MPKTINPVKKSKNTKIIVPFHEMPEEYTIVDRKDSDQYSGATKIFAKVPRAQTLMILYDKENGHIRSVYQSPASFDDEARNYPEKNHETFYHISGEKLVNLILKVSCHLSAYGQTNALIPQLASDEEVRNMSRARANDVSNWDDPFGFQEDWSTVEDLCIDRVVEEIRETGRNSPKARRFELITLRDIAMNLPVEFSPSKYGSEILELLKAAERGVVIPAEVFMYAAVKKAEVGGEIFAPEFIDNLKSKAIGASENAVYSHMMDESPLSKGMMAVDSEEIIEYQAGSVLRESPQAPVEYRVYQDKQDANNFVLAGVTNKDVMIDGQGETSCCIDKIDKGMIHVIMSHPFIGDTYLKTDEFHDHFIALDKASAETALVKYFGYKRQTRDVDSTVSQPGVAGIS